MDGRFPTRLYIKMNKTNSELLSSGDPRMIATRVPDGDDCVEYIQMSECESNIKSFWEVIKSVMDTNQRIVVEDYIKESIEEKYGKNTNNAEKHKDKNS